MKLVTYLMVPFYCLMTGCASFFGGSGYDSRTITIQTLSLFNQRQKSRFSSNHWEGDWIFRRDRLDMVDRTLRDTKPDLIFLQEVMAKIGSPAENDRNILSRGGLEGYGWAQTASDNFQNTKEVESMAVAVGQPLSVQGERQGRIILDDDMYAQWVVIEFESHPFLVVNLNLPDNWLSSLDPVYRKLRVEIDRLLSSQKLCPQRLILGGRIPASELSKEFFQLLARYGLKDTAEDFCPTVMECATATPSNWLFMATETTQTQSQVDRILVHEDSIVGSAGRLYTQSAKIAEYSKQYGLEAVNPSQRFGWSASIRLPQCDD